HQVLQLPRVILRIPVGVEDPILRGAIETCTQRAAITPILLVMDNPNLIRVYTRQLIQDSRRVILTAVIDDDDLVLISQLAQGQQYGDDHTADGTGIVIRREKCGNTKFISHTIR